MHSSTNTQILHRQSRSFAEHTALGEYYEAIIPLVDTLTEAIQGLEGELIDYPVDYYGPAASGLEELSSLKEYVAEERKVLPDNSEIQNLVDEIADLINSTLYKLRFLK
jgi:DNA-binding ferritin-like protein